MRVISFIEDPEVIKKILKHLGASGCRKEGPNLGLTGHPRVSI
jgi:hypothetical protein